MTVPVPKFTSLVTYITADFANSVSELVYGVFGAATTAASARLNLGLGTIATQSAGEVQITGGSIDGTTIGYVTPSLARFSMAYVLNAPVNPLHAANKAYVDQKIQDAVGLTVGLETKYVALIGSTMTGPLVLSGDPVLANAAATKHYVDEQIALVQIQQLPPATTSTLGGIIVGPGLIVTDTGLLSATALPLSPATASTLGGVIVGDGLSVTGNGTLSAQVYTLPAATTGALGGIIVGDGLNVTPNGTLSATAVPLVPATTTTLGGVIVSTGLTIDLTGNLSVVAATALTLGGVIAGQGLSVTNNGTLSVSPASTSTLGGIIVGAGLSITPQGVLSAGGTGVTAFNTRTGAITLLGSDISSAGGALLANPAFTGTPTAPTAAPGTSTTQLATTAFVAAAISGLPAYAPLASPAFTGVPTGPTAAAGTSTTQLATTAFVAASKYYDFQGGAGGLITAGQTLALQPSVRTVTFPANFAGSVAVATVAPTNATTISINIGATNVGTISFAAGSKVGTFTSVGGAVVTINPGQYLQAIASGTADATFANVAFTLLGQAV